MNFLSLSPLALAAALLAGPAATAQEAGRDVAELQAMTACRAIAEPQARAACYDASVAAFSEAVSSGELAIIERRAVREVEREGFGLTVPGLDGLRQIFASNGGDGERPDPEPSVMENGAVAEYAADGRLEAIRGAPVSSVEENRQGRLVIELQSGETWVQTQTERILPVRERHIEAGLTAEIESGAFGSFFMTLSHSPYDRFRVQRVQ